MFLVWELLGLGKGTELFSPCLMELATIYLSWTLYFSCLSHSLSWSAWVYWFLFCLYLGFLLSVFAANFLITQMDTFSCALFAVCFQEQTTYFYSFPCYFPNTLCLPFCGCGSFDISLVHPFRLGHENAIFLVQRQKRLVFDRSFPLLASQNGLCERIPINTLDNPFVAFVSIKVSVAINYSGYLTNRDTRFEKPRVRRLGIK